MSGYSGYSKSNNAITAEQRNCFPASVLAKKLKLSTDAIKKFMETTEWHHSSGWYNMVDYYDGDLLIKLTNNIFPTNYDEEEIQEAEELLEKMISFSKKKKKDNKKSIYHPNCEVEWLEWYGSKRSPKCQKKTFIGGVTVKGVTATIHLPSGDIKKRLSANGFSFRKLEEKGE